MNEILNFYLGLLPLKDFIMGTPGVPLNFDKAVITSAIKKHRGRLYNVAKELGCHYETVRKYTDPHPDLVELIANLRKDFDENLCNSAEDTLTDAMEGRKKDMASALRSAFFVLNNKGIDRGYTPPHNMVKDDGKKVTPEQINQLQQIIDENK